MHACLASLRLQWRFFTCSRIALNIATPSHQDYCLRVCAVCWRKAQRKAYPTEEALIQEFVISNYTTESAFFSSGICAACRFEVHSSNFGKSSIQKGIKSALQDRKNIFESLFDVKKIPMESSGGVITPHSVVYCRDVDLFINRIAALRCKAVSDIRVKFGIDYGQSFLKVTMTLTTASRISSGMCLCL